MTAQRRGVALTPMETRHDVIVRTAQLADELGYEAFSLPEGWGLDSTVVLAQLALSTRRITLVSGVMSVWGRTAGTLAMAAATLHHASGGRYVLGLGASTAALAEGFHDVPFVRPAERLRDTTTKVRALLAGERAVLDAGRDARPLRLGQPPVPELPIWLAAMGWRSVLVAAQVADGWFPLFLARDHLADRLRGLAVARAAARVMAAPLTVAAGPMTVVDADAGAARAIAATTVAWYLCAMGDGYARVVAEQGYADEVRAVVAANPRPSPRHGVVPDAAEALMEQFTASGTPGDVRDRLKSWDEEVDVTMLGLPPGMPWATIEATLRAAAPARD
jgi:alkanesulfonate monooxygenase SsuD/methylene tetrahydromethanopterin reductase-like flavin-dependent oxidoreductase (luciferase family)